jgi:hypothetical protein
MVTSNTCNHHARSIIGMRLRFSAPAAARVCATAEYQTDLAP